MKTASEIRALIDDDATDERQALHAIVDALDAAGLLPAAAAAGAPAPETPAP